MSGPVFCADCTPFPVCDFCRSYKFNPSPSGAYTGDGWCLLLKQPMDPGDGCDEFHCKDAPDK